MSLIPAACDGDNNPFHLHPNLLHINMRTNKKIRKLEVSCIFVMYARFFF